MDGAELQRVENWGEVEGEVGQGGGCAGGGERGGGEMILIRSWLIYWNGINLCKNSS